MKRILIASAVAVTVMAAVAIGTAWGASGAPSSAVITFDDGAQQVTLQIPSPACPTTQPGCEWKFFLNEPKLSVDVATIYGTSGTLTLAYPPDFCGVIQADAYVGPPWVAKRGWQHTIACTPSDTATSVLPNSGGATATTVETATTAAPTPPTNQPVHGGTNAPVTPTGTTPSTVELPESQAAAGAPTVSPPAAGASATTPTALPETAATGARPTSLPFTGADLQPFVYLGTLFVVLGIVLMARRRKHPL